MNKYLLLLIGLVSFWACQKEDFSDELAAANKEIAELKAQLRAQAAEDDATITSLEQQLANLQASSAEDAATIAELSSELAELHAEIASLNDQLDNGDIDVSEYTDAIAELEAEIDDLEAQVTELAVQLQDANDLIATLTANAGDSAGAIEELSSQLTEANATIDSLNTQVTSLNTQVESLTSSNTSLVAEVATLTASLTSAIAERDALNAEVVSLTASLTAITSELASVTAALDASEISEAEAQEEIASLEAQIASLNTTISNYATQVIDLNNTIDALNTKVSSLEDEIAELKECVYVSTDVAVTDITSSTSYSDWTPANAASDVATITQTRDKTVTTVTKVTTTTSFEVESGVDCPAKSKVVTSTSTSVDVVTQESQVINNPNYVADAEATFVSGTDGLTFSSTVTGTTNGTEWMEVYFKLTKTSSDTFLPFGEIDINVDSDVNNNASIYASNNSNVAILKIVFNNSIPVNDDIEVTVGDFVYADEVIVVGGEFQGELTQGGSYRYRVIITKSGDSWPNYAVSENSSSAYALTSAKLNGSANNVYTVDVAALGDTRIVDFIFSDGNQHGKLELDVTGLVE